ncbi:MAG: tRNA (adenosine(37)-N6)-threonylcarbamoyltransferase complex ATPase subunit type 1 TsaE [Paludibacter sp.]
MNIKIESINSINECARVFISQMGANKIFLFNGNMGVGKTTFIKSICKELGTKDTVNSPTFSIINEYKTDDNIIIYHFDCYRINKIEDALEIGIEEYLESGNICFIEWAENIASLLPDNFVTIQIEENEDGSRNVMID